MVLVDLVVLLAVIIGFGMPAIMAMRGLHALLGFHRTARGVVARTPDGGDDRSDRQDPSMLTKDVLDRIERIGALAKESLARLDGATRNPVIDEIVTMRDVHLRDLVHAYCAIPERHRHDILGGTKVDATARLIEGLDGMTARLVEIETEISRGSLDAFADTTRFVATRYGTRRDHI